MSIDAAINLLIAAACAGIAWACLCRMDKMHAATKPLFRLKYTALASGSIAGALAPWLFPDAPRLGGLLFAVAVLAFLLMGASAWKDRAPDYSERGRAPGRTPDASARSCR